MSLGRFQRRRGRFVCSTKGHPMRRVLVVFGLLALAACGASFVGTATSDMGDKCQGHLSCPLGCCRGAQMDGEGWECTVPPSESKNVCEYVGLSDDGNGMFGARRKDAGR
jgi:hypothetical protein